MKNISRSALLPYPADTLYDMVNDVAAYPEFLPWCDHAEVLEMSDTHMVARVGIRKGPVHQSFTTRNTLVPGKSIHFQLVEGPFKTLEGQWQFIPLDKTACKIAFEVNYEVAGGLFGRMLAPLFEQIATTLVDAFSKRARSLHG